MNKCSCGKLLPENECICINCLTAQIIANKPILEAKQKADNEREQIRLKAIVEGENKLLIHFRDDITPKVRGRLLKFFKDNKTYHNGDKSKVYTYPELIDKAIKENLNICFNDLIMNNLKYGFNLDTQKWEVYP